MKKITSVLLLITAFSLASAQTLSDYEYVYVPKELEKKINNYKLDKQLVKSLNSKKYKTLQDNEENWPTELQLNKCQVAKANILNDSGFLSIKTKVQFKDCNDKVILELNGSSKEKDYEIGFPESLREAVLSLPISNPKENLMISKTDNTNNNATSTSNAETYTNGAIALQRVNIGAGQFIFVKNNSSVPFATLKESTKSGVFHVKLENGISTIAYIENGNIVIEIPQSNDSYKKEVFQKK